MKTPQELFDRTVRHLAKQGKRSEIVPGGLCALRSADGTLRCAIGCNIPDEYYRPEMESKIGTLVASDFDSDVQDVLFAAGVGEDSVEMMALLQHVHDKEPLAEWRKELMPAGAACSMRLAVFEEPAVKEAFDKLEAEEQADDS